MKTIKGGITAPKGFTANGLWCGIKRSGKPDLSLIFSTVLSTAVGLFTKNSVIAAPLIVTKENLKNNKAQAIIINSGNANCFTGKQGLTNSKKTIKTISQILNIDSQNTLVASTGIIGKHLPYKEIKNACPDLAKGLDKKKSNLAARGILTTDTVSKEIALEISIGGKKARLGAMAKGSGMIAPSMATMLAFITTDINIKPSLLKQALKESCDKSFHCITVDNCMSTNDMVIVMANGLSGNKIIKNKGKDYKTFATALDIICLDLAKKIVQDAEGATKFITVHVSGAKNTTQAKKIAFAIANSNLVKTAAYGSNPNWGRVAAAIGSLGMGITEKMIQIKFSSFTKKNISILVNIGLSSGQATVYTSDLSLEYVKINGKYN